MKNNTKCVGVSMVLLLPAVLTGCGGMKSDLKDAINAEISTQQTCFSLQNNNVSWPVNLSTFDLNLTQHPVLAAMKKAKLVAVKQVTGSFYQQYLQLMPINGAAKYWSKDGFCVGHEAVDKVLEWTTPGDRGGIQMTQVTYTWKLTGVPSWADSDAFKSIKGMSKPVKAMSIVVKTNNGWKAKF